jgi:hypothetical protein
MRSRMLIAVRSAFVLCLAAAMVAGCTSAPGEVAQTPVTTRSPDSSATLTTVDWGVTDGLLSVVVRNDSPHTIRLARAIITATDVRGAAIATASAPTGARCCTILNVAPKREYGLYTYLGAGPAQRVHTVRVAFADFSYGPASTVNTLSTSNAHLDTSGSDASVTATFTLAGPGGPYVAGQAFLVDPRGRLVAVISGRFYCIVANKPLRVRMQLFHPVPAGTRVKTVLGYPVPEEITDTAQDLPTCSQSAAHTGSATRTNAPAKAPITARSSRARSTRPRTAGRSS